MSVTAIHVRTCHYQSPAELGLAVEGGKVQGTHTLWVTLVGISPRPQEHPGEVHAGALDSCVQWRAGSAPRTHLPWRLFQQLRDQPQSVLLLGSRFVASEQRLSKLIEVKRFQYRLLLCGIAANGRAEVLRGTSRRTPCAVAGTPTG